MSTAHPPQNPLLKLALEIGPLVAFFLANRQGNIFLATGVFMGAVVISLGVSYLLLRRLPIMPVISVVVVLVFGGLTLYFNDSTFIKLKPTIVNTLFGCVLLIGLWFGKSLLTVVLDSVLHLTPEGWKKLTFRWALFFFALAIINELVWRTQTENFWVNFKVFGIMPLTMVFALAQTPLILRYAVEPDTDGDGAGKPG